MVVDRGVGFVQPGAVVVTVVVGRAVADDGHLCTVSEVLIEDAVLGDHDRLGLSVFLEQEDRDIVGAPGIVVLDGLGHLDDLAAVAVVVGRQDDLGDPTRTVPCGQHHIRRDQHPGTAHGVAEDDACGVFVVALGDLGTADHLLGARGQDQGKHVRLRGWRLIVPVDRPPVCD